MPAADTARLVAELSLDQKGFAKGVSAANKSIGKLEATVGRVGQRAGEGLKSFGRNVGLIGVAAAGGIAVAVKGGLDSLAELESAITSVDGAIAQMGQTGQITGKEVADWANDIEASIGAAFDDKEITAAATTLIRFGKVAPKNLKKALEVMTDLAVKTGDVESASSLLAKVLADPAKAAGKLSKVGIVLTKVQQDQIKAMVEAGDVVGAQAVLMDELAKSTKGAAAASQGPYQRSLSILQDVTEDAQKALATGFLPVIQKVADLLSRELGKPETLDNIRKFGEGLAGGLDDLISIAQKLPWQTIGDSLKLGAAGAKTILEMFTSLPPWVQTAVLTGWGLNKLTGGALGGIVAELGKGLIKGVLGMTAGVVNINAGTVNDGGGVGGPGGGGGLLKVGAAAAIGVTIIGVATTAATALAEAINPGVTAGTVGLGNRQPQANATSPTAQDIRTYWAGGSPIVDATKDGNAYLQNIANERMEALKAEQKAAVAKITDGNMEIAGVNFAIRNARADEKAQASAVAAQAAASSASERTAIANAAAAQTAAQARTTEAARSAAAAIRDKDLSVTVNVPPARISIANFIDGQRMYTRLHNVAS